MFDPPCVFHGNRTCHDKSCSRFAFGRKEDIGKRRRSDMTYREPIVPVIVIVDNRATTQQSDLQKLARGKCLCR